MIVRHAVRLLTLLLVLLCVAAPTHGAETPPNIIIIMADDLGWQDVAFAGARFFETPHTLTGSPVRE